MIAPRRTRPSCLSSLLLVVLIPAAVAASACAAAASAACEADEQCAAGLVCDLVSNTCVTAGSPDAAGGPPGPTADGTGADEVDAESVDRCVSASYEGRIDALGKKHGAPCDADAECMYGLCYKDSVLTGGAGICTKDCGCGDETTTCRFDDPMDSSFVYVCYRPPIRGDNIDSLGSYCVPRCASNGDATSVAQWCQTINPALDTCETPSVGNPEPLCTIGGR